MHMIILQEQHVNVVQLDIPKHSVRVADVFAVLEQEKGDYNIVYYTVSQTTLETVSSWLHCMLDYI